MKITRTGLSEDNLRYYGDLCEVSLKRPDSLNELIPAELDIDFQKPVRLMDDGRRLADILDWSWGRAGPIGREKYGSVEGKTELCRLRHGENDVVTIDDHHLRPGGITDFRLYKSLIDSYDFASERASIQEVVGAGRTATFIIDVSPDLPIGLLAEAILSIDSIKLVPESPDPQAMQHNAFDSIYIHVFDGLFVRASFLEEDDLPTPTGP